MSDIQKKTYSNRNTYSLDIVFKCNDQESELKRLQQVLRKNPKDAEAHYRLGLLYDNLGHYKDALNSFRQAENLVRSTRVSKADIRRAIDSADHAFSQLVAGHYVKAVSLFESALELYPDFKRAQDGLKVAAGKINPPDTTREAASAGTDTSDSDVDQFAFKEQASKFRLKLSKSFKAIRIKM